MENKFKEVNKVIEDYRTSIVMQSSMNVDTTDLKAQDLIMALYVQLRKIKYYINNINTGRS